VTGTARDGASDDRVHNIAAMAHDEVTAVTLVSTVF